MEGIQTRKEIVKLLLFANNVIFVLATKPHEGLLKLIRDFGKVTGKKN